MPEASRRAWFDALEHYPSANVECHHDDKDDEQRICHARLVVFVPIPATPMARHARGIVPSPTSND